MHFLFFFTFGIGFFPFCMMRQTNKIIKRKIHVCTRISTIFYYCTKNYSCTCQQTRPTIIKAGLFIYMHLYTLQNQWQTNTPPSSSRSGLPLRTYLLIRQLPFVTQQHHTLSDSSELVDFFRWASEIWWRNVLKKFKTQKSWFAFFNYFVDKSLAWPIAHWAS